LIYTLRPHAKRAATWAEIAGLQRGVTGRVTRSARVSWHSILHIFAYPLYYIDYGIALLGALQVWLHSRTNYREAVEQYWHVDVGRIRPLPEPLRRRALPPDYEILKPLMDANEQELERTAD
jgi:hypothetical protein